MAGLHLFLDFLALSLLHFLVFCKLLLLGFKLCLFVHLIFQNQISISLQFLLSLLQLLFLLSLLILSLALNPSLPLLITLIFLLPTLIQYLPTSQPLGLHNRKKNPNLLIPPQYLTHPLDSILIRQIEWCLPILVITVQIQSAIEMEDRETFLSTPHCTLVETS